MRYSIHVLIVGLIFLMQSRDTLFAENFIRADHPYIQYYGRWDRHDSTCAKYSWPGVYLEAEFTGAASVFVWMIIRIISMFISTDRSSVFFTAHIRESRLRACKKSSGRESYAAFKPPEYYIRRTVFFLRTSAGQRCVDPQPSPKLDRKIEFIGDSFTAAESNETKAQSLPWEERYPVTNIDKGFAPVVARHFHAQYATICRSGAGMFCDWRGDTGATLPKLYKRTAYGKSGTTLEFPARVPQVAVVSLGLMTSQRSHSDPGSRLRLAGPIAGNSKVVPLFPEPSPDSFGSVAPVSPLQSQNIRLRNGIWSQIAHESAAPQPERIPYRY